MIKFWLYEEQTQLIKPGVISEGVVRFSCPRIWLIRSSLKENGQTSGCIFRTRGMKASPRKVQVFVCHRNTITFQAKVQFITKWLWIKCDCSLWRQSNGRFRMWEDAVARKGWRHFCSLWWKSKMLVTWKYSIDKKGVMNSFKNTFHHNGGDRLGGDDFNIENIYTWIKNLFTENNWNLKFNVSPAGYN